MGKSDQEWISCFGGPYIYIYPSISPHRELPTASSLWVPDHFPNAGPKTSASKAPGNKPGPAARALAHAASQGVGVRENGSHHFGLRIFGKIMASYFKHHSESRHVSSVTWIQSTLISKHWFSQLVSKSSQRSPMLNQSGRGRPDRCLRDGFVL